jgi:hypothetical protein
MSWFNLAAAGAYGRALKLRHTASESEPSSRELSDYSVPRDDFGVFEEISRLSDGSIDFRRYADRARSIRAREARTWILSASRAIAGRTRGARHV